MEEFTESQKAVIEKMIFDKLPCATNRTCQEVSQLKETVKAIDTRTWLILASIIVGTLIQIALKV